MWCACLHLPLFLLQCAYVLLFLMLEHGALLPGTWPWLYVFSISGACSYYSYSWSSTGASWFPVLERSVLLPDAFFYCPGSSRLADSCAWLFSVSWSAILNGGGAHVHGACTWACHVETMHHGGFLIYVDDKGLHPAFKLVLKTSGFAVRLLTLHGPRRTCGTVQLASV